jgi:hypothetical protein
MFRPTRNNSWRKNSLCKSIGLALLFFLFFDAQVFAQMSGSAYKIPLDSLNVGGQQSSGTLYNELDTMGEIGSGESSGTLYKMNAGFLGAQPTYIAITSNGSVSMSPSISGISGGTGTGSMSWTVTTDNPAGYAMNVHSDTTPSMRSASSSFADYTPAGSNPDYNWSVAAADSEFGFSPEGTDVVQRFLDNGSACNTGTSETTGKCWDALTTSDTLIAQSSSGNHPTGTLTTVKIQAEVGSSHIQPNGNYTATVLVTALPL